MIYIFFSLHDISIQTRSDDPSGIMSICKQEVLGTHSGENHSG